MQMAGDRRKLLLFFTGEKREDFHQKTEEILEKVARIERESVVVVKTCSEVAMKRVLKVEPDQFATIRLIDVHSLQKPVFGASTENEALSRQKYKGPFKVENLCKFVVGQRWEEHYESKGKLSTIKTIGWQELQRSSNTVVLFEKEGCEGCHYVGESLEELKRIVRVIGERSRLRQQYIYRFGIVDPNRLSSIQIRRHSVFNDNPTFSVPSTTPKLFLLSQGRPADL
jgi:hypothetical protein